MRSLPNARWTIPGSVSAARINVRRPIIPNWSVTIPEGMFVTRPAAAGLYRVEHIAETGLWSTINTYCQYITSKSLNHSLCTHWRANQANYPLTCNGHWLTNGKMMMVCIMLSVFFWFAHFSLSSNYLTPNTGLRAKLPHPSCVIKKGCLSRIGAIRLAERSHHRATPGSLSSGCCSVLRSSCLLETWAHLHWMCSCLWSSSS